MLKPSRIIVWATLALLALLPITTATAQDIDPNPTWYGQYYNNDALSGAPDLLRSDGDISFNWGTGSPAPTINADNFSIRWTTDSYFTRGTYLFSARADDAIRVRLNGYTIIDTWFDAGVGRDIERAVTLADGLYTLQVEYRENQVNAYVTFDWVLDLTAPPQSIDIPAPPPQSAPYPFDVPPAPPTQPAPVSPITGGIWQAEYFANQNLTGAPVVTQTENSPTHYWGTGAPSPLVPADNFSARWTTTYTLQPGTYRITADADDGIRVYVDGRLVIDEWHQATSGTYSASLNLTSGLHTVTVEYYENEIIAYLSFNLEYLGAVSDPVIPTNAVARTGPFSVNVRTEPSTETGRIITTVQPGSSYPVIGRNLDRSWWQIRVNGQTGWVFSRFVDVTNGVDVPVTSLTAPTLIQGTGYYVTAEQNASIRANPASGSAFLGTLREGLRAEVIALSPGQRWVKIRYDNAVGWVLADTVTLQPGVPLEFIPIETDTRGLPGD